MQLKKPIKNFIIIFFLGISSGLPLALVLSTLKAFLLDKGFDLKTIGFFALVGIPYSLKIFFAPIIDSCSVPILTRLLGQRKSWIVLTQIFLAVFIIGLGIAGIASSLTTIAVFSLLLALASAAQDIVIDGYRIELIEKNDQALAASFYIYGYRIGILISGALSLVLADIISWDAVYFIMAGFMILAVIITIFADETKKSLIKNQSLTLWFKNFVIAPALDLMRHNRWYIILIFIVCFKLGDSFAGNLTLPFLLDIGFTKIEVATILKTFGLFATLFGVFFGGILVKKFGIINSLWAAGIMQMLSNLSFSYLATIGHNAKILYLVVFAENFSCGIGDSVFVAYLSALCNRNFSATQYAILVSCASLSRSALSASAGAFAQSLGWYQFFILSTVLAVPGLVFLYFLNGRK